MQPHRTECQAFEAAGRKIVLRETRVFLPMTGRFRRPDPWPNIFGLLVRPAVEMLGTQWFWFSRYAQNLDDPDLQDCDPQHFPAEFYCTVDGRPGLLSFRLRYAIDGDRHTEFEAAATRIFSAHSAVPRYFREYSLAGDLGNGRFTADDAKRERRSEIVGTLVHATSQLVLHALSGPNSVGDYEFEAIAFDVPHHLVSNITAKPG